MRAVTISCLIEDCPKEPWARGWCPSHYSRWYRHGDPLAGGPPKGLPVAVRFWTKVDFNGPLPERRPDLGPCWLWTGTRFSSGYGEFSVGGRSDNKMLRAHRWAYEFCVGPIPEGLTIDHLCFTPLCVLPDHLEPIPSGVNALRGNGPAATNARKTHCLEGHPFDEANTYRNPSRTMRRCRTCTRARQAVAR